MGRKSTKTDKNIYQTSREELDFTRDAADELMSFISADRIEKIESGKSLPHPEEILAMAECYKKPELCNYYCSHECPIGRKTVPALEAKELSQITLEIIASLNSLEKEKARLIEISVDGRISSEERPDFDTISQKLDSIAQSVASLKLWIEKATLSGSVE